MTGRRRFPRFLLSTPTDGNLQVREEVAIERWGAGELEAVSTVPCRCDEELTLELPGDEDGRLRVTVRESRPVVAPDGSIRYRLRLSFAQAAVSTISDEGLRES